MSEIKKSVELYLSTRRSLGYQLRGSDRILHSFASFLDEQGCAHITTELVLRYVRPPERHSGLGEAKRLSIIRCFARHHRAIDPRTEVPPTDLLPFHYVRKPPYIYTENDIHRLIEAARNLACPSGLRALTYSTLVALQSVSALRISEAIALDDSDIDFGQRILLIQRTKFRKSRLVPIHPSTAQALESYRARRKEIFPRSSTLFVSPHGKRICRSTVDVTFHLLLEQVGLLPTDDRPRPCLHGLRHTFAVRTLLGWYREGADVEQRIPELATYLGHTHVTGTYWYLSATPELLRLAAERREGPLWRMRS